MLNGPQFATSFALTILTASLLLVPAMAEAKDSWALIVIASGPLMLIGTIAFGVSGQFADPSIAYGIGAAMCLASSCILAAAGMALAYKQMKR